MLLGLPKKSSVVVYLNLYINVFHKRNSSRTNKEFPISQSRQRLKMFVSPDDGINQPTRGWAWDRRGRKAVNPHLGVLFTCSKGIVQTKRICLQYDKCPLGHRCGPLEAWVWIHPGEFCTWYTARPSSHHYRLNGVWIYGLCFFLLHLTETLEFFCLFLISSSAIAIVGVSSGDGGRIV